MTAMSKKIIPNVVCTFCGSTCDELQVTVEDGKVVGVRSGCSSSLSKFLNYNVKRQLAPLVRKNGELHETSYEDAIRISAEILANARYPLLYGWSSTSNEASRVGLELAEWAGGVMDNTTTVCHGPTLLAVHDIGEISASLGEIMQRADLVIYWGSNAVHSHPHHVMRYSAMSKGRFRLSRKDRTMVVVDVRKTDTAKLADQFIQITPNSDYEFMCALRMAVRGDELEQDVIAGVPAERIEELAELMISCQFGVIFFGLGLTMTQGMHRNVDVALSLVRDLNARTKFLIMPMRGHFNVNGANQVSAWVTGYPYAVDLSQGFPRYNPGDTTAVDLLARGDCDAALVVASDVVSNFPVEASRNLAKIPVITIDPHPSSTTLVSEVVFPTTIVGIETGGTIYRMDGVAIMTKPVVSPPPGLHADVEILQDILKHVKKLKMGQ
jgi:formylmethanofuran dehydrogenase subunit B